MAMHWKLHPIVHLKGDISDIASMHYDARVLQRLGITYRYLREELHMDDDWMRMLRYRPKVCHPSVHACACNAARNVIFRRSGRSFWGLGIWRRSRWGMQGSRRSS